jgi:hypothetical protein
MSSILNWLMDDCHESNSHFTLKWQWPIVKSVLSYRLEI